MFRIRLAARFCRLSAETSKVLRMSVEESWKSFLPLKHYLHLLRWKYTLEEFPNVEVVFSISEMESDVNFIYAQYALVM